MVVRALGWVNEKQKNREKHLRKTFGFWVRKTLNLSVFDARMPRFVKCQCIHLWLTEGTKDIICSPTLRYHPLPQVIQMS